MDSPKAHPGRADLIGLTLLLQSLDLSSNCADEAAYEIERISILLGIGLVIVGAVTNVIHGQRVRVP